MRWFSVLLLVWPSLWAQEAESGIAVGGTVSGLAAYSHQLSQEPRGGSPVAGGFRAILYPTWKIDRNWSVSAAVDVNSSPYFYEDFTKPGYSVESYIIRAHLTYSRIRENRSLVVRVGELTSAFGSFLLRYDDAVNPLIDMPPSYGYYGRGVTSKGMPGAQVDATLGKFDARVQLTNSSPANPRSPLDGDQYANWAGGAGYTISQGFRVGVSAYRGPYLDRGSEFFHPGESPPRELPATAYGFDMKWGRGPWNVYGEVQRFQFTYHAMPTFAETVGYGEVRRTFGPRWYAAARISAVHYNRIPSRRVYETAIGYRPNRRQLIKVGYEAEEGPSIRGSLSNTFAIQLVTTLPEFSLATR
jgi:hypothetical protein